MKQCTKCLAEFEDTYSFCSKCGGPLMDVDQFEQEPSPPMGKPCPKCNALNDPAYRFCMACGEPFEDPAAMSSDSGKSAAEFWYASPSVGPEASEAAEDVHVSAEFEPPIFNNGTSGEETQEVLEEPESSTIFPDESSEDDALGIAELQINTDALQEDYNGEVKSSIPAHIENDFEGSERIERVAEPSEVRIDDDAYVNLSRKCQACKTLNEEICLYCRNCGRPLDVPGSFQTVATSGALAPLADWGKTALSRLAEVDWSHKISTIGSRLWTSFLSKPAGHLKSLLERIRHVPWSAKIAGARSTLASLLFWKPLGLGKRIYGKVTKIRWSRKRIMVVSGIASVVLISVVGLLVLPPNWLSSTNRYMPFSDANLHVAQSKPAKVEAQTTPDNNFGKPPLSEKGSLPADSPTYVWENHRPPPETGKANVASPDVALPDGAFDAFEQFFSEGLEATKVSNFELAEQKFQEAVRLFPNSASAWNNLGLCQRQLGNLEGAITAYNSAIRSDPKFALAYKNLGVAQEKMGNLEQAIDAYFKYVQLAADATDAAHVRERAEILRTKSLQGPRQ